MFHWFQTVPQPDIFIRGIQISEPVTAFTGLLISSVCGYALYDLRRHPERSREMQWMWYFFLFMGLSNVFGSLAGHAFLHRLGIEWKAPGWTLGMIAVFIVGQVSVMRFRAWSPGATGPAFTVFNSIALAWLFSATVTELNFKMVEAYSAIGLLLVMLPLEISLFRKGEKEASFWMMMALAPAVLAVVLHIIRFSVSKWLNYFDLGHILLCFTVLFFLKATRLMRQVPESSIC